MKSLLHMYYKMFSRYYFVLLVFWSEISSYKKHNLKIVLLLTTLSFLVLDDSIELVFVTSISDAAKSCNETSKKMGYCLDLPIIFNIFDIAAFIVKFFFQFGPIFKIIERNNCPSTFHIILRSKNWQTVYFYEDRTKLKTLLYFQKIRKFYNSKIKK